MSAATPHSRPEVVLGIDFGTTYSSAAALVGGRVHLVLDGGDPLIPTVVHVPVQGPPLVGRAAQQQAILDPYNTVSSIKRLVGRSVDDPEVKQLDVGVGFTIRGGPRRQALLTLRGLDYSPAQMAGVVLERIRQLAEHRFGGPIRRAVLTVPAAASPSYCRAMVQAARFAGMQVAELLAEPVAGVLALGEHLKPAERRLAVCDFGGGTFDATLVTQSGYTFTPVAVHGDAFLGGDDFDEAMARAVASEVFAQTRTDMHRDIARWRELIWRCESVKRQLSTMSEAPLSMKDALVHAGRTADLRMTIRRAWIEPRWQPLAERATEVLAHLLELARWRASDVDEVLLIGGTTLIPLVQKSFAAFFGRPVKTSNRAEVAVTVGAALQTAAHGAPGEPRPQLGRPAAHAAA